MDMIFFDLPPRDERLKNSKLFQIRARTCYKYRKQINIPTLICNLRYPAGSMDAIRHSNKKNAHGFYTLSASVSLYILTTCGPIMDSSSRSRAVFLLSSSAVSTKESFRTASRMACEMASGSSAGTMKPLSPSLIHSFAQDVLDWIGKAPITTASNKEVLMASEILKPMYTREHPYQ